MSVDDAVKVDLGQACERLNSEQSESQTGVEFALTPEVRIIVTLCSITLINRVDEDTDKLAKWFGLIEREANWVPSAKAENEDDGYSEALLGVDGEGWFPFWCGRASTKSNCLRQKSDRFRSGVGPISA